MEKSYTITTKKGVNVTDIDELLASTSGDEFIPKRSCVLSDIYLNDFRSTSWVLTEEEAKALQEHPQIQSVVKNKTDKELEEERDLVLRNIEVDGGAIEGDKGFSMGEFVKAPAAPSSTHSNWGLKRHSKSSYTDGTEDGGITYENNYHYDYDGTGVDIVIHDLGIDPSAPEWMGRDGQSRFKMIDWKYEIYKDIMYDALDGVVTLEEYQRDIHNNYSKTMMGYQLGGLNTNPRRYPEMTDKQAEIYRQLKLWYATTERATNPNHPEYHPADELETISPVDFHPYWVLLGYYVNEYYAPDVFEPLNKQMYYGVPSKAVAEPYWTGGTGDFKDADMQDFIYRVQTHGTSCAAIAAGRKYGFAKNADIYLLARYPTTYYRDHFTADAPEEIVGTGSPNLNPYHFSLAVAAWHKNKFREGGSQRPTVFSHSGWDGYAANARATSQLFEHGEGDYPIRGVYRGQEWTYDGETPHELYAKYGFWWSVENSRQFGTGGGLMERDHHDWLGALIDHGIHVCQAMGNDNFEIDVPYPSAATDDEFDGASLDWDNVVYYKYRTAYVINTQSLRSDFNERRAANNEHSHYEYMGHWNQDNGLKDWMFSDADDAIQPEMWYETYTRSLYTHKPNYPHDHRAYNVGSLSRVLWENSIDEGNFYEVPAATSVKGQGVNIWAAGTDIHTIDVAFAGIYRPQGSDYHQPAQQSRNHNTRVVNVGFSGTSAACPQVAGIVALYLEKYPEYALDPVGLRAKVFEESEAQTAKISPPRSVRELTQGDTDRHENGSVHQHGARRIIHVPYSEKLGERELTIKGNLVLTTNVYSQQSSMEITNLAHEAGQLDHTYYIEATIKKDDGTETVPDHDVTFKTSHGELVGEVERQPNGKYRIGIRSDSNGIANIQCFVYAKPIAQDLTLYFGTPEGYPLNTSFSSIDLEEGIWGGSEDSPFWIELLSVQSETPYTITKISGDLGLDGNWVTIPFTLDWGNSQTHTLNYKVENEVGFVLGTYTINVIPESTAPTLTWASRTFTIEENHNPEDAVGNAHASDASTPLVYTKIQGSDDLTLDTDGQIYLPYSADYEHATQYSLTFTATDTRGNVSDEGQIIIKVTDAPLTNPVISSGTGSTINISETTDESIVVHTVTATDAELPLTFAKVSGDDTLSIDAATGEITLTGGAIYDTASSHTITYSVTDNEGADVEDTLIVAVTPPNPLVITSGGTLLSVPENSDEHVGVPLYTATTDQDGASFCFVETPDTTNEKQELNVGGGSFTIDSSTGVISLGSALNIESFSHSFIDDNFDGQTRTYSFYIRATKGSQQVHKLLTGTITNVFDHGVTITSDDMVKNAVGYYTVDVDENAAVDTELGNFKLYESYTPRFDNRIINSQYTTYTIMSGDPDGHFSVSSDGKITVNGALDYSTKSMYVLAVQASAMGLETTTTFIININEVVSPEFLDHNGILEVAAGTSNGQVIAEFSELINTNGLNVTYTLLSGGYGWMGWNYQVNSSGQLITNVNLPSSAGVHYGFLLRVTGDNGTEVTKEFYVHTVNSYIEEAVMNVGYLNVMGYVYYGYEHGSYYAYGHLLDVDTNNSYTGTQDFPAGNLCSVSNTYIKALNYYINGNKFVFNIEQPTSTYNNALWNTMEIDGVSIDRTFLNSSTSPYDLQYHSYSVGNPFGTSNGANKDIKWS